MLTIGNTDAEIFLLVVADETKHLCPFSLSTRLLSGVVILNEVKNLRDIWRDSPLPSVVQNDRDCLMLNRKRYYFHIV